MLNNEFLSEKKNSACKLSNTEKISVKYNKQYLFVGYCPLQANIKDGERCTSASCFLRPVMSRSNLQVVTNSHVARVQSVTILYIRCNNLSVILLHFSI